jgi:hypothetical protein
MRIEHFQRLSQVYCRLSPDISADAKRHQTIQSDSLNDFCRRMWFRPSECETIAPKRSLVLLETQWRFQ